MSEEKTGTAATRAKQKYNAKAYDQLLVFVSKGERARIDEIAKKLGYKSRNEFINQAIKEKIERENL